MSEKDGSSLSMQAKGSQSKNQQQQQQKNQNPQRPSSRKRPFHASSAVSWKNLPAFCDAAGAVSAPLYAARRLPEMQQLWYTTQQQNNKNHQDCNHQQRLATLSSSSSSSSKNNRFSTMELPYLSGGGKSSTRHLRRRITSFACRKRHRFPRGGGGIIKDLPLKQLSPQNKQQQQQQQAKDAKKALLPSRRARRRDRQGLQLLHQTWATDADSFAETTTTTTTTNVVDVIQQVGNVVSSSNDNSIATAGGVPASSNQAPPHIYWMKTHVWHAKRFHMVDLWHWKVPLLHTNRGSRAALRLVRDGSTLLQDVTWKYGQPIVLPFSANSGGISLTILMTLTQCFPAMIFTKSIMSGMQMAEGILHEMNQFPGGVIGPGMIWVAPRTVLQQQHGSNNGDGTTSINSTTISQQRTETTFRVHVWVHPVIRPKALRCLQEWAIKRMGIVLQDSITTTGTAVVPDGPKACLQLRGKAATNTLTHLSLSTIICGPKQCWDWNKLERYPNLHELLPHGSVVFVKFETKQESSSPSPAEDEDDMLEANDERKKSPIVTDSQTDFAVEIGSMLNDWQANQETNTFSNTNLDRLFLRDDIIMLVSQCPRNPKLLHNAGCCGWDVLIHPDKVHHVFMTLVLQGKACPMGMLDEAHLRLECEPPLPTFPRDYPDTDEGMEYWQSSNREWRLVRTCLEGGWGRLNIPKWKTSEKGAAVRRLCQIQWNDLVMPAGASTTANADISDVTTTINAAAATTATITETTATTLPIAVTETTTTTTTHATTAAALRTKVVVMRGAQFGQPILNAMQCCGQLPTMRTPTEASRRPKRRRRVRSPHEHAHTIPNPPQQQESLQEMIAAMLASLSLPAVISCRLLIDGRGTLDAGARIWMWDEAHCEGNQYYDDNNNDDWIGFVTAGAFSPIRGHCHGIGMIGAARFLQSLLRRAASKIHNYGQGVGRVVLQPDGSRQVETLVRVSCCCNQQSTTTTFPKSMVSYQATISLLLE